MYAAVACTYPVAVVLKDGSRCTSPLQPRGGRRSTKDTVGDVTYGRPHGPVAEKITLATGFSLVFFPPGTLYIVIQ